MEKTIKAYKGFNADMTCRNFQYAEGQEYDTTEDIKICENGFHACENPIDVLQYYNPNTSVYHEVELSGNINKDIIDSKVCASHIKIGARLDIPTICRLTFDYVKSNCTNADNPIKSKAATAGSYGAATSRGKSAVGDKGIACARGYNVRVKGGLGAILVIAEERKDSYDIAAWKAVIVDGEKIKADTWYRLDNEELVEDVELNNSENENDKDNA
jgi:hypothetical protein